MKLSDVKKLSAAIVVFDETMSHEFKSAVVLFNSDRNFKALLKKIKEFGSQKWKKEAEIEIQREQDRR